ncbi:MAG: hypothetical protein ACYC7D_05250 [Nitrososphaerales archaeon]
MGRTGFRVARQRGSHVRLEKVTSSKILKLTM